MNKFKESLQVTNSNLKTYDTFDEKVSNEIYNAILNVKAEDREEKIRKMELLININKIMSHYEELRPTLTKFFEDKKSKVR